MNRPTVGWVGAWLPRRSNLPLRFGDDLPLFVASDRDLAAAIVGPDPERKQIWLADLPRLEACGFPKLTPGMGRCRPAVKSFYDRFYDHSRYLTPSNRRSCGAS